MEWGGGRKKDKEEEKEKAKEKEKESENKMVVVQYPCCSVVIIFLSPTIILCHQS